MIRRSFLGRALGAIAGAVCAPLVGRGATKWEGVISVDPASSDCSVSVMDLYGPGPGFKRFVLDGNEWKELPSWRSSEPPYSMLETFHDAWTFTAPPQEQPNA